MKYRRAILGGFFFVLVLFFGARIARAQDEPQEPADTMPKPAARSTPIPIIDSGNPQDDNGMQDTTNRLLPDVTPLTGLQNATLGSPDLSHSYWVPGFQYANTVQSSNYGQPNSSGWFVTNYLMANVSLLKAWSRSQLAINYSGGGFFSTNSTQGNGNYQQLGLSQTFQSNRWLVQILDQFSYLPQSQFGFGAGTNLGIPGIAGSLGPSVPGLGGGTVPSQSIYASFGPRISNVGVIQATYTVSPRGSITASGSYAILHFVQSGNVDNNSTTGSLGYNYQLDSKNTLGLQYRFSSDQFPGEPQAFGDNIVNIAYGRKITGRLSLQFSGGPEYTTFRVPIGTQSSKLGVNANANFIYGFENGSFSAGYVHGLAGGSGVFTGSTSDQLNSAASRKLGRIWSANFNFGYARNSAVASSTEAGLPTYNSWFVGGGVGRPIGRDANLAISYTADIFGSSQSGCSGATCGSNQTSNYITLSFQWHTRPFVLQ
jgi:hypothetical protein